MLFDYTKKVIKNGSNAFSIISFCLALVMVFVPIPDNIKTPIISLFVILALFYSTYKLYLTETKVDKGGLLIKIKSKSASHKGMTGDGMILDSEIFVIANAEVSNSTNKTYSLEFPVLEIYEMNEDLLDKSSVNLDITSNDFSRLPTDVSPDTKIRFNIKIKMKILSENVRSFAQDLNNLGSFKFGTKFNAEDMDTEKIEYELVIDGDFGEVKQIFETYWKERKMYELLCLHNGIISGS